MASQKATESQKFEKHLEEVNRRLKASKAGVTLIQKGNSLYARGTFPPKPGSTKTEPHQQEIALKVRAHPLGLKEAEAKAQAIGAALVLKEFDWADYTVRPLKTNEARTVADWISALEQDYFDRRKRTPKSECTWKTSYRVYIRRLPQEQPLTLELLEQAVRKTEPDSSTRSRLCFACQVLGRFAGLNVEPIKALKGCYSSSRPKPRNLPNDEEIVQAISQMKNPAWRWVAGMLATYGLRPHEVFHLNTQNLENGGDTIEVLHGKTGARKVPALYPEWIEQFNLRQKYLPLVTGKDNQTLGERVSSAFRRADMPFKPYDLRHCWAVRSLRFKIEVSLTARRMGHTVLIHTRTYQAWITEAIDRQAYQAAIQHPDRPQAPVIVLPAALPFVEAQSDSLAIIPAVTEPEQESAVVSSEASSQLAVSVSVEPVDSNHSQPTPTTANEPLACQLIGAAL